MINYSRQLDRIELRLCQIEMLLRVLVQRGNIDPQQVADLTAQLAQSEANLLASIAAQTPPAKP